MNADKHRSEKQELGSVTSVLGGAILSFLVFSSLRLSGSILFPDLRVSASCAADWLDRLL
jgi:hypothetical protein